MKKLSGMVTEIRLHGRGGQGVVLAAHLISTASYYDSEKVFCRSFGMYGVERRGAPVTSFAVIGKKDEITRSMAYNPDHVIVLDPNIPNHVNVVEGVKNNSTLTISIGSSTEILDKIETEDKNMRIGSLNATSIAKEVLGIPIPNTTLLGGFTRFTEFFSLDSLNKAIEDRFGEKLSVKNKKAAKEGFDKVNIGKL